MPNAMLMLLVYGLMATVGPLAAESTDSFKVVVNAANEESSITKARLSTLFLKKVTRWSSGEKVLAIELDRRSPVPKDFSRIVHERDTAWIEGYWNKMIFSGRGAPPFEAMSDEEVLAFVRANPNAIGYVSRAAQVGSGLKVLEVVE